MGFRVAGKGACLSGKGACRFPIAHPTRVLGMQDLQKQSWGRLPIGSCVDIWLCTGYMIEVASHHLSDKAPSTLATANCQGRDLVQNRLLVLAS